MKKTAEARMNQRYPRGYRHADERQSFRTLEEEELENSKPVVPTDVLNKFKKGTLAELKDPLRKSEKVIRKEVLPDLYLDIYLFGKGTDINK
jgi:hypothetical protein